MEELGKGRRRELNTQKTAQITAQKGWTGGECPTFLHGIVDRELDLDS